MVKRYRHISELTPSDIDLLARVLCLPPTARLSVDGSPSHQWLHQQSEQVSQLPRPLQRPNNWLERLSVYTNQKLSLTIEDLIPQCAVLCDAHKGLNPWVVHRVFLLLSEEVTRRLDPLRRYVKDPARYDKDKAVRLETSPGEVRKYVDRMNGLLSLWTGPEVFGRIVGGDYPPGLVLPRVGSDCEACIVACVGARAQALCDLRAMMCGRSQRRGPPVLLRLVDAWIERFDEEVAEMLMSESAAMAGDVRRIRRKVVKRGAGRHHHRHHHRTPHEKREKERVRMERDLDSQKLTTSQRRIALGEIDKKLDEMFGRESRKKDYPEGKHSSSSAFTVSASTFASSTSARSISTIKPSRHNNDSTPVDNHQQTSRGSWEDYSYIVDESRGYDGGNEIEPFPDYNDEFNEADPDATYRLQDQVQSWYDRYTDVGASADKAEVCSHAHPAFSQKVGDIEDHFMRSQMAMSAVPSPLHFRKDVAPRDGEDDDDDDWVPAATRTEISLWTDVSVHTLATQFTHKSGRGGGGPNSEGAAPVPQLPSIHRAGATSRMAEGQKYPNDHASTAFGLLQDVAERNRSGAYGVFYPPPSSVYSNDAPTAAHPPPAATTVVPAAAYSSPRHQGPDARPLDQGATGGFMDGKYENPRTPPRVPEPQHRRSQHGALRVADTSLSEVTQWPSTYGTSAPSSGSRHRKNHSSSSSAPRRSVTSTPNTTLSSQEFQAGLDRIKRHQYGDGVRLGGDFVDATTTATTILPGDSVSAVGRFYPPEDPGVAHRYQLRRDQIDADEALARQLARTALCERPR